MIFSPKILIQIIKCMFFFEKKDSNVQLALLPSCSPRSKLGFLLVLISYINQVTYQFLWVTGFSLFQTSLLSAMQPDGSGDQFYGQFRPLTEKIIEDQDPDQEEDRSIVPDDPNDQFSWLVVARAKYNGIQQCSDQDGNESEKLKRKHLETLTQEHGLAQREPKKTKYSHTTVTRENHGQSGADMEAQDSNQQDYRWRTNKESSHPLTQPFFQKMPFSSRVQEIRNDIDNWREKILSCEESSIFFNKEDLEKYKKIFEIHPHDIEPIQGLNFVKFNDLLIDSDNPNNVNSGNTGAEVSILPFKGGKIAIKKFKDFQVGLKEFFSSLIAMDVNSSPETKMLTPFDAVYIPGSGFAMLMEGAYTHDIYHYLLTPLAGKVIDACAHYFAEFHIKAHQDLINYDENMGDTEQNLIKPLLKKYRERYIEHLLKASETLYDPSYQEETAIELLSLLPGTSRDKLNENEERLMGTPSSVPMPSKFETINSDTIVRQLFDNEQEAFILLSKHTINSFKNNSWEIFRSLREKKQKFYPLVRVHGDAHGGNFFYDDREFPSNGMNIPEDSSLRISMIDFASMVRTLNGGSLEEDVARFLGSLWVQASQYPETSNYYKDIYYLQERFIEVYSNEIKKRCIVSEENLENFKKIFKENCNFYKLRFYKVVFNLPNDKMNNDAKLKVLKSWIKENSELVSILQKTALPASPIKKLQSLFLKQVQGDIVYWLPDRPNGFIESMAERTGKSYLTLLGETLERKSTAAFSSSATIAGMGGVGKTSLALQYAHEALKSRAYNLIYWVAAPSLLKVYKRLLIEIGIPINDLNDSSIIELVKEHLPKQGRCLLIYDDVPNPGFLEGKVPAGIHSLYTSRCNEGWGNFLLELNVFSPQESIKHLLDITSLKINDETESQVRKLAEGLGYFPLALAIAGNSIKLKKGQSVTASCFVKYLKKLSSAEGNQNLFRKERMKLTYENLVGKTLKIATKQVSLLAKKILVYSSYLDSETIAEDIFSCCTENKNELERALSQLASLSLIKRMPKDSMFTLHQLVQGVIRKEEESTNLDQGAFLELAPVFIDRFKQNTLSDQPIDILLKDFSHILKILEHSEHLKGSDQEINHVMGLKWAGRVLHIIEDRSLISRKKRGEKSYKKYEKFFLNSINNHLIPDWLQKNPHPKVQFALGYMFRKKDYVERNFKTAIFYYTEAANQGDVDAQYFLAELYETGNYPEAIKWFAEAAKQGDTMALEALWEYANNGDAEAQYNLGNLYANGFGVKQNEDEALKWFERAHCNGHYEASIAFEVLQALRNSMVVDF